MEERGTSCRPVRQRALLPRPPPSLRRQRAFAVVDFGGSLSLSKQDKGTKLSSFSTCATSNAAAAVAADDRGSGVASSWLFVQPLPSLASLFPPMKKTLDAKKEPCCSTCGGGSWMGCRKTGILATVRLLRDIRVSRKLARFQRVCWPTRASCFPLCVERSLLSNQHRAYVAY